jgi:hypothetical protein
MVEMAFFVTGLGTLQILGVENAHRWLELEWYIRESRLDPGSKGSF